MSTLRSILAMVTAGSVGAVTAVAVTMLMASPPERADASAPAPSRASSKARTSSDRDVRPASDDARLIRLERKVHGLATELEDDVRPAASRDASQPSVFDGPPPDEADLNCETSVAMPPPEDPSAPYGAEILFVCPDGGRS